MKIRKTKEIDCTGLGAIIKAARKRDSRSLKELSRLAGITPTHWYEIEAEKVKYLPMQTFQRIRDVLNLHFDFEE